MSRKTTMKRTVVIKDEEWLVEWFRRDPVTGNFVRDTPPQQFTTADLTRIIEEKATLLSNVERLTRALEQARRVVASDADACAAFGAPGEESEPGHVLTIIDEALSNTTQRAAE